MQTERRLLFLLLAFSFAVLSLPAFAQQVIATVSVGSQPRAVAVNSVTNKIYAGNSCGNDPTCNSSGTVTVIDGATDDTTTVTVEAGPAAIAVNSVTNKIYATNSCGNHPNCVYPYPPGTVTVIDGATNNTTTVNVGGDPRALAVNSVTNKIYVADYGDDNVTVIDGITNNTTIVNVGGLPNAVAVNPVTNKIYVANGGSGSVTVIDGATNNTTIVDVGGGTLPDAVAVNSVTNKIYVANGDSGSVTVIDGATLNTTPVPVGAGQAAAGVNSVTNQIYVADSYDNGTATVIDGATLNTTPVPVGLFPMAVGVDPVTNQIYVANLYSDTVTLIDGATLVTTTIGVGVKPLTLAVNPVTNRVYVVNECGNDLNCNSNGTVSVIAGANSTALQFVPVTPCRLYDTRPQYGGSGPIQGGTSQAFNLPQLALAKGCESLSSAAAYSLNVAVVPQGALGYLTLWPTGEDQPVVATLNSLDGRIKANAAIVPAGYQGAVSVYVTNTTNVVIDIDGYFAPVGSSTLAFYPMTPCRVADTRKSSFPAGLGPPNLSAKTPRDFPVLSSTCNIPSTVQAYSLNLSAVPYPSLGYPLGYLEVWPTGQMPANPVSTLNNLTGTVVANAAIVPAGTGGDITVFPSNDTDLVIDINGYFAPARPGGLSLYPSAPCRVIDTRKVGSGQPFSGLLNPPVDVVDSICAPPSTAKAYVFNATVVPSGFLGYLTLWQNDPMHQPVVSTLNALDGWITNNMAIVPTSDGKIDAYASGITQLILDISSYFAP